MEEIKMKLAIEGGEPSVRTPVPPRKRHGEKELQHLADVIESDVLFFFLGSKVRQFEKQFSGLYRRQYCIACSSGTAAVHMAIAALQLPPGSEVITSAITDMGSITGILYQGLIPVFADIDPETLNMDPRSVRAALTDRTGAILVVHHAGLAADLDAILSIAKERNIPVIEDCAQAYGCEYKGELVGRHGIASCFSLNHFKHISTGSGGMVVTDDDQLRYVASLFLDKCYQREEGVRNPYFLAPNYQMTELQGAIALAQLDRLAEFTARRTALGDRLISGIQNINGIHVQKVEKGSKHSYFLLLFKIDLDVFGTAAEFAEALRAEGVAAKENLITGGRPVYLYNIFQNCSAFPGSSYPFRSLDTGTNRSYPPGLCPVAEDAFQRWIVVELLENYTEQNVDEIVLAIRKVAHHCANRRSALLPS